MLGQYAPPDDMTLSAAKSDADLILSGTVQSVAPQPTVPIPTSKVTIDVTRIFKGTTGSTVTILQGSYLDSFDNWRTPTIVDAVTGPLLLPGDSVFLFLKAGPNELLYAEGYTGIYYIRGGAVQSLSVNPFASHVNGLSPDSFSAAIQNA